MSVAPGSGTSPVAPVRFLARSVGDGGPVGAPTEADVDAALDRLRAELVGSSPVVVALLGGVDSALVAAVAHEVLGDGALAVTAVSPSLAEAERELGRAFVVGGERGDGEAEVC